MSDFDNYIPGTVPDWFARQLVEKKYAIGETIEFPRIFAEDHIIIDYVEQRGWSIEYVGKRGKAHRLIKEKVDAVDKGTVAENSVVMEDLVPNASQSEIDSILDDVIHDMEMVEEEENEKDIEFMRSILESERWKIIGGRRGRVNTYEEQRLEELDALLGPIEVPEKELKDYW
jgi:hypothetical protein